jgi:hypothetical protein
LGYVGIRYAAFPGTFFAQVWLTSGVGLIMFSLYRRRAIPLVWFASLVINGSFALLAMPTNGVLATIALIIFSPLFDTLQGFLAWRLWRLDNEPRFSRIGLQRFLLAIIVAVMISVAGIAILHLAVGLISTDELLSRFTMMALSDMQGLFWWCPCGSRCATKLLQSLITHYFLAHWRFLFHCYWRGLSHRSRHYYFRWWLLLLFVCDLLVLHWRYQLPVAVRHCSWYSVWTLYIWARVLKPLAAGR